VLWRTLPALPVLTTGMSYGQLLRSMLTLLGTERTLQVRGMIGFFLFAAFSTFWTALVLPLSAPPLSMSHGAMGAFGLVGVVGALAAARAGHWTDQGFGQLTTGLALGCLMLAWLPVALLHQSIFALIIGIVLLDLGGQAVHVVNQSLILTTRPEASSRLIGCYRLFYSAGSGLGAMASTWVYAQAGWSGVCILGFTASALAMAFWLVTRFTTRSATACHGTRQTRSMAAPADCNAPAE
jgi:predicted MFS family arabinose efflux permease